VGARDLLALYCLTAAAWSGEAAAARPAAPPRAGQFIEAPAFPTAGHPMGAATGDFNGDGIPALVGGRDSSTLGGHFGRPGGGLSPATLLDLHDDVDDWPSSHWAVAAGDLNGDGRDDIVVSSLEAGHLSVFLAQDGGQFKLAVRLKNIVSFG